MRPDMTQTTLLHVMLSAVFYGCFWNLKISRALIHIGSFDEEGTALWEVLTSTETLSDLNVWKSPCWRPCGLHSFSTGVTKCELSMLRIRSTLYSIKCDAARSLRSRNIKSGLTFHAFLPLGLAWIVVSPPSTACTATWCVRGCHSDEARSKTSTSWQASSSHVTTSADCVSSCLASASEFSHLNGQHMDGVFFHPLIFHVSHVIVCCFWIVWLKV